jgi:hypothetical protein
MTIRSASAALLATLVIAAPAGAQEGVALGTLVCTGGAGVGLIIGSQKTYECIFSPALGRQPEAYLATITKLGLDLGVTGTSTLVWTVVSPARDLGDRPLAGIYAGVAADASVGIGPGGKVLVGGFNRSIALQPISVQNQTGVNLALGVAELELR